MNLFLIGLGGSLGAISRYLINEFFIKFIPTEYPIGILSINVIGCFFIGYYLGTNLMVRGWPVLSICHWLFRIFHHHVSFYPSNYKYA